MLEQKPNESHGGSHCSPITCSRPLGRCAWPRLLRSGPHQHRVQEHLVQARPAARSVGSWVKITERPRPRGVSWSQTSRPREPTWCRPRPSRSGAAVLQEGDHAAALAADRVEPVSGDGDGELDTALLGRFVAVAEELRGPSARGRERRGGKWRYARPASPAGGSDGPVGVQGDRVASRFWTSRSWRSPSRPSWWGRRCRCTSRDRRRGRRCAAA